MVRKTLATATMGPLIVAHVTVAAARLVAVMGLPATVVLM